MPDLIIAVLLGLVERLTESVSSWTSPDCIGNVCSHSSRSSSWTAFAGLRGWGLLALTTLPALILGAIAHGFIRAQLFDPKTVVIGLGVGGVAIPLVLGVLAHARMRSRGGSSSSSTSACQARGHLCIRPLWQRTCMSALETGSTTCTDDPECSRFRGETCRTSPSAFLVPRSARVLCVYLATFDQSLSLTTDYRRSRQAEE